ncbi:hypothetical protein [Aquipuribacter sp. MA13-6]|uniref:hypothetical protein n=1 Tax=unclassified Aquipuribacter TaxID=2635084 RepID=UPI003EECB488
MTESPDRPKLDPHFFAREEDGSVRVRIRLTADRATAIENAAGDVPLVQWINRVIDAASRQAEIPSATRLPRPSRTTDDDKDRR